MAQCSRNRPGSLRNQRLDPDHCGGGQHVVKQLESALATTTVVWPSRCGSMSAVC